jgi:hypothetical protein
MRGTQALGKLKGPETEIPWINAAKSRAVGEAAKGSRPALDKCRQPGPDSRPGLDNKGHTVDSMSPEHNSVRHTIGRTIDNNRHP